MAPPPGNRPPTTTKAKHTPGKKRTKGKKKQHYFTDSSQNFPDNVSDLAELDPISLQAVLDDIETGWAFEEYPPSTHSLGDGDADGNGGGDSVVPPGVEQILNSLPPELQLEVQQQQQQRNRPGGDVRSRSSASASASASRDRRSKSHGSTSRRSRHTTFSSSTSGGPNSNSAFSIMLGAGGTGMPPRVVVIIVSVFSLGILAMALILGYGLESEANQQNYLFRSLEEQVLEKIQTTLQDYVTTGLLLHQASAQPTMDHAGFQIFFQYLASTGVLFPACGLAAYVADDSQRQSMENETYAYLKTVYPDHTPFYTGFWGNDSPPNSTSSLPDFDYLPPNHSTSYYPLHFLEPLDDPFIRLFLDFDLATLPSLARAMDRAVRTGTPSLSDLLVLPTNDTFRTMNVPWYETHTVLLWHPGINLTTPTQQQQQQQQQLNRDLSVMVIKMADIFRAVNTLDLERTVSLYIYDSTDTLDNDNDSDDTATNSNMTFLGGAQFLKSSHRNSPQPQFQPPIDFATLEEDFAPFINATKFQFTNHREWTLVVALDEDELPFQVTLIFLAGYTIFVACSCFALWVHSNFYRTARINELRRTGETEKAMLMIDNARKAAKQERALNDFLAHEVRNPLSAAISATSFVSSAIHENHPLATEESRQSVREDVNIIDASLQFINDLLRNMLDMHRAAVGQLSVALAPVDILHDVLEPVANMLYRRDAEYEVLLECPEGLMILSDRLRLKQTILNLARNAAKFVIRGFVRLRAEIGEDEMVTLFVEDSGPGVPEDKQKALFKKFQESLDVLSQGTGIGLSLCQTIMQKLEGQLRLDPNYHSGIDGSPGARFVIALQKPALTEDAMTKQTADFESNEVLKEYVAEKESTEIAVDHVPAKGTEPPDVVPPPGIELPESLSVLFVDDDPMLRKLFSRSLKRAMPGWKVREASNGETALRLVDDEEFDVLFLDQYMSSAEKQLLGTETARKLRSKGVSETIICGLSANDMGSNFIKAGADIFLMKPFPCKGDELENTLLDVLHTRGKKYFTSRQPNDADAQKVSFALSDKSESLTPSLPVATTEGKAKPSLSGLASPSSLTSSGHQTNTAPVQTQAPLSSLNTQATPLFSLTGANPTTSEECSPLLANNLHLEQSAILSSKARHANGTRQIPESLTQPAPLFQLKQNRPPPAPLFQLDEKPAQPAPLFLLESSSSPAPSFEPSGAQEAPEKDSESTAVTKEISEDQAPREGAPTYITTSASTRLTSASNADNKPAPLW